MSNNYPTNLKIISFCLYGSSDRYCIGAIENVKLAKIYYPEWICRFYLDDTVPSDVINQLKEEGADVLYEKDYKSSVNVKMCRRFLPLLDTNVDVWISRDTDSRLTRRESIAVKEWIDSDKTCHIMRDAYNHANYILGGMFGIKNTLFREKYDKNINIFLSNCDCYGTDQEILAHNLWHIIKDDHMYHDYWSYSIPLLNTTNNHSIIDCFSKPRKELFPQLYSNKGESRKFIEDELDPENHGLYVGQIFFDNRPDNNDEYTLRNIKYAR